MCWDKLLKIKTSGRDDSRADTYKYPYEPTPYEVLDRLANSGLITKKDVLLDYGSGKGRVEFFFSWQVRCHTIGIEYDERLYDRAILNMETAPATGRIQFLLENAESFQVPAEVNRCFFFNPFSVEIMQKVMARILESWYDDSREILLFFYYPSDEYISWLMTVDELSFFDEIDCRDLFEGNDDRELIMIFQIEGTISQPLSESFVIGMMNIWDFWNSDYRGII
mgnify:CR=1 FL=1